MYSKLNFMNKHKVRRSSLVHSTRIFYEFFRCVCCVPAINADLFDMFEVLEAIIKIVSHADV